MRQFVVEKQNLKNGLIEVIGKDFRYLRQVLRVKKGDMLNVRFDDGSLQGTTVSFIDDSGKKITLQVCESKENTITRGVQADQLGGFFSERDFVLFQFIPKPQKFELIIRQATECGISQIVPVIGEFCDKNCLHMFEGAKKERFDRIIREARQQSGSPVATKITRPMKVEEALDWWKEFSGAGTSSLSLVLWERTEGEVPLNQLVNEHKNASKI
ncbi:MAG: RsmE family RNA methyltransferase, partial [Treponema sp.]|nr:RsmE family RNA methyltransferase [Treponema sp.]